MKQLAKADEEYLREAAARIRMQMAQDIIAIGLELIAVKGRVGHGRFLSWIDIEFEMSEPTAVRMMNVAREYGGKSFNVKDLKRSVLYELAAPSTPPEVRAKIESRVLAGEKVTLADVHALKQEMEQRAYVVEHGIAELAEAVDHGDVPVPAAVAFVRNHEPSLQKKLIGKAHSAGEAVVAANAAVKVRADRAAGKKQQQPEPQLTLDEPAQSDPIQGESDDRAKGRSRQRLDAEFEQRVLAECQKRIEETILPSYNETLAFCDDVIKARKGVMDRKTFTLIRSCLHTDSRKSVSDEKLNEAFRLFSEMELRLLDETQHPTPTIRMPRTYREMMALKQKVSEERKAKRAAGRSAT